MIRNTASVRLEIRDRQSLERLTEIIQSIQGFRILPHQGPAAGIKTAACDLLVLEIGADPERDFQTVASLQKSGTVAEVILTSSNTDPEILLQALRSGAREFLPQPIRPDEARNALAWFKERQANSPGTAVNRGKLLAVLGSKGGVGTTTVAVNVAASVARLNGKLPSALMDLNLLFGEVPLFMDLKSTISWGDMAKEISRLDSTYLMSTLSQHATGVYVLPAPQSLDGMNAATPDTIESMISQLQETFGMLVVDCGSSLNDLSLKILEMADVVLVVSVLSLPCLVNVKKMIEIFQRMGYPDESSVKVVANRFQKRSLITIEEAEKSIGRKVFWAIPNDYRSTMTAINQSMPLETLGQKNEVTASYRDLAAALVSRKKTAAQEKPRLIESLFAKRAMT